MMKLSKPPLVSHSFPAALHWSGECSPFWAPYIPTVEIHTASGSCDSCGVIYWQACVESKTGKGSETSQGPNHTASKAKERPILMFPARAIIHRPAWVASTGGS